MVVSVNGVAVLGTDDRWRVDRTRIVSTASTTASGALLLWQPPEGLESYVPRL